MAKKCPPGFICFENITLLIILIILIIGLYYYIQYVLNNNDKNQNTKIIETQTSNIFIPQPSQMQIPVTVRTQRMELNYRQVGILTRVSGENTILPLYGRMVNTSRTKWQYYTMNDKSNAIKLPMSHNGRSCTSEYGCDELMSGDTVYVEGYNDAFKVTIYENSQPRYIPFL